MEEKSESINLGDTIQLSGFKELEHGALIVVKKLVGTQVKKFQESIKDFQRINIHLKTVHKTEQNMKYELHAGLIHGGKNINVETIDRNIFMALSSIFEKLETLIKKE